MTTISIPPPTTDSTASPKYFVRPGGVVTFELADPTLTATVDFDSSRCCFSNSKPITLSGSNPSESRTVSENATGGYQFNMSFGGGSGSMRHPGGNKESKVGDLDVTTEPPPPPKEHKKR